jgi:transcriptional regulator with XRE-family HTH domain
VNIGKGIKFVRVAANLRQSEMAERLQISQNYLSLLENNKADPSIELIRRISEVFGVPANFLLWEDAMPSEGHTPEVSAKYNQISYSRIATVTYITTIWHRGEVTCLWSRERFD